MAIALRELDAARSGRRQMSPGQAGLPSVLDGYSRSTAGGGSTTASPSSSPNALQGGEPVLDLVGAGISLLAACFDI